MQWETKVKFSGQVKSAGIDKGTHWKLGSVDFDYDAVSSSWLVKLFLKVNPNRVCQQMTIKKPNQLDVKSGRLMIEDKKGDGIHIKLSSADVANAKRLVEKIKVSVATIDSYNKAEVGLRPAPPLPIHRGSENIRPVINDGFGDRSSVRRREDCSPERQSGGWLSKMTPPMKRRDHNPAPKRRLELFSPERDKGSYSAREGNTERHGSSLKFTGMKDFSKRDITGGNGGALTNGLGPKSFYGSQNSIVNSSASLGSISVSSSNLRGTDHSPALKKYKLSPSPSFSSQSSNKMPPARDLNSASPPDSHHVPASDSWVPRQNDGTPRRHFRAGETIGFENLGNTCFLNSPLQCLSALEPLCLDIQSAIAEYGAELNSNSLTRKLYLLMKDVRKLDVCPARLRDLLIRLRRDMNIKFAPNTQQDAHELLSELLNRIDEEVKAAAQRYQATPISSSLLAQGAVGREVAVRPHPGEDGASSQEAKYTPTEANFCWSYRTCISFHECKTEVLSAQTEQEMTLMLAFDSSTKTLQDCINKYFESTELEMKCEKCGKDEKATITRKIVKRPRYFILNLLRYHTDNMETTKKADHIFIPSYISVCGYCAEDVTKPPHVDSVFMLESNSRNQTKKVSFKPQQFEDKGLSDTSTELPDLLADTLPLDTYDHDQVAVQRSRSGSNEEGKGPESSAESSDFLSELVECVSCNLRFVDRFLEDADMKGSDIRELYEYAQVITTMIASVVKPSKTRELPDAQQQQNEGADDQSSEHNMLVGQELLKTAFNVKGASAAVEHTQNIIVQQIIKELVATRYVHISRDKSLDHLIGDLAMYVSAVRCRILTANDKAEIVASETFKKVLSNVDQLDAEEPHRKSASDWGGRVPSSAYHSRGKPWSRDEASKLKSSDSMHHSRGKPWSLDEMNKSVSETSGKVFDSSSNKSSYMKSAEDKWKDQHSEEDYSVDLATYSSTEHLEKNPEIEEFLRSPEKNRVKRRIKNIQMLTEDELQKLDCSSLTEEEMLTYAQALSRFAYEREQVAQMDLSAAGAGDLMDICGSFEKVEDESSFGEVPDSRTQPNGRSMKEALNSTTEIDIEGISATSSLSNNTKSDESGFLSPSNKTSLVKLSRSTNSTEEHPEQDSNIEPNLLCQEDLNDVDETDGGKMYSEYQFPSQIECPNILRSSTSITEAHLVPDLDATQAKPCISCGSLCYTACTSCGAIDQTDLELNTSDSNLTLISTKSLKFSGTLIDKSKFSTTKEFSEEHAETSHEKPEKDAGLSDFKSKETTTVSPTEGHSLSKQKDGSNVQLIPPSSPQSCKKEYLFSPTKTSNLVKTRDYARLRSPSASPKKKKVSTSKWLHFSDDKDKKDSTSLFGKDENVSSSSDSLGTSMEVQVDDMTFLESIDVSSFVDPLTAPSKDQHSTPKAGTNKNVSPLLKSLTKDANDSVSPSHHSLIDKYNSASATPVVEELERIHHSSGVIQQASVKSEPLTTSSYSGKVRDISLQENVETEVIDVRLKSSKQMTDVTADTEEKENLYHYEARAKQLQNIELGRAEHSYKLVGVVDHTGNTQFTGHYTAYALNLSKQKWFHLNDSETRVVTEREVQEVNTQTGYLFFYMDKDLFHEYKSKVPSATS